jgi:hypothetical protein
MSKKQIQNTIRWAGAVIVCVILFAVFDQAVDAELLFEIIERMSSQ